MIGPHQGKELELMLAGKKPFAFFYDVVPASGKISDEIIPENVFAPHVKSGAIKRFVEDIKSKNDVVRYVCFTLPDEEWRAQFLFWYKKELVSQSLSYGHSHEYIIGNLLGYERKDVEDYLNRSSLLNKAVRA